jgi:hypothetical protein
MKLSNIKIDSDVLEHGAWVGDIPGLGDLRLKVRGLGNADYRRRHSELTAALPRHLRKDPLQQDQIVQTLILETLLLDWDKVEDESGKPLKFSPAAVGEILADPDMRAFGEGVIWAASVVADGKQATKALDAGN